MSLFDSIEAAGRKVQNAVFGEFFDVLPKQQVGDKKPSDDPTRDQLIGIVGIYSGPPMMAALAKEMNAAETGRAPGLAGQAHRVSFDLIHLPWRPAAPDIVVRRKTGERFRIEKPMPDGGGGVAYSLIALGA